MSACEQPRYFPLAGPARDFLAPGLRVAFSGKYAVYYQHAPAELIVVRVLHSARDIDVVVGGGGFND